MKKKITIYFNLFLLILVQNLQAQAPTTQAVGINKTTQTENWVEKRTNFWNGWIDKCFPNKDWNTTTFSTVGIDYATFKVSNPEIDNQMRALYNTSADADKYLPGIVNSGSSIPLSLKVKQGTKFYKIVYKGGNINSPSPYYLSEKEYKWIKNHLQFLEQKLGLPLSSVNAQYDVFTLTAKVNCVAFQSIIAATKQFANATPAVIYNAPGGKTQSLIINNNNIDFWLKSTTPIESLSPNVLPQLANESK